MDERDFALLSVVFSLIGHLSHEGILDRDRLVQFLLEQLALSDRSESAPPAEKLVNEYIDVLIQMLERTQFPPARE